MKANEAKLKALLDGQKQYVVPLFQRPYSWRRRHWETLWQDVVELYESDSQEHFLGAIVTLSQLGAPEGVASYLLIDGQQRLITLSLLLAALRDHANGFDRTIAQRVHGLYLENHFVEGLDKAKVLPTHADRTPFVDTIGGANAAADSPVKDAYAYFRSALDAGGTQDEPLSVSRLLNIILSQLDFVSITLDIDDNPYRIFESLNAKGMRLTQADLLRNYFFMRLPASEHEHLYSAIWEPMQSRLGKRLDEFVRDFLVRDGTFVRSGDVYQAWKKRLDQSSTDDVRTALSALGQFSEYYLHLIRSATEPDPTVRRQLARLNRWGGTTTYPFLLNLYEEIGAGRLGKDGLARALQLIESFLVRRLFANVPTNELNRLFIRLYGQLPKEDDLVEATWHALSQPGLRWPTDAEFQEGILRYPLYRDSRPGQRRLILEMLEESYGHAEPVQWEALTVEHVMPQTPTSEWLADLGANAKEVHRGLVHTLGNLTLSGYNQPLSNSPFERKQQILACSHLELNREIAAENQWTAREIEERALRLVQKAKEIWPGPRRR